MCLNQLFGSNHVPQGYFTATEEDPTEDWASQPWNQQKHSEKLLFLSGCRVRETYSMSLREGSSSEAVSLSWIARRQVKFPAGLGCTCNFGTLSHVMYLTINHGCNCYLILEIWPPRKRRSGSLSGPHVCTIIPSKCGPGRWVVLDSASILPEQIALA